jgi:hypothetical protein
VRYHKFNLQALVDAVVKVVGNEAKSCATELLILSTLLRMLWRSFNNNQASNAGIKILKCVEGQFHRAFILTMDDGKEVFVKLPHPNAGPAFYSTASEVATRHFVSQMRIFGFSSRI